MGQHLMTKQVQQYHDNGLLIINEPVFSQQKVAAFTARFEIHMEAWEEAMGGPPELIDRAHFFDP